MIAIGIDPGLKGGIAVPPGCVYDMPITAFGKGFVKNAVDLKALALLLAPYYDLKSHVFIERVNAFPDQGVASMFSLGMSFWGAAGVCAGLGLPFTLVSPKKWKGHFKLGRDKKDSLVLARKLYPGVQLKFKQDHGKAEALLIARYGRETTK